VTIQKVNEGLDTGDIAREGHVPIGSRSLSSIWRDLENLGLDLYMQAIFDVKQGNTAYRPQTGKKGKLYRDPKLGDIFRVWRLQSAKWISEKLG
jgi:methionyl-tRNA formyltransferase